MKVMKMKYQIRLLQKQDELKRLTDLEREVWGFPEDDSDSLLTMKVMPNQEFKIGYTFGTFFEDELIACFSPRRCRGDFMGIWFALNLRTEIKTSTLAS
jgi:predicted GNAT superfamily acetyltransferase